MSTVSIQKALITALLSTIIALPLMYAQKTERKIIFPDTERYRTLKCDFHIHTVFSDGTVWPTIRIDEAVKDGLDAISLTEHIEYQPWKEDIPHPDRNRSYNIAVEAAKPHDLLIVHGTEITRDLPPGHANALFVTDVNKIVGHEKYIDAYKAAAAQGAFIFWNHPNWVNQEKDGIPQITPEHRELIDMNLLHGLEVVNDLTYSEEALRIAIENDITVMGTSDIHGLVDWQYDLAGGGHRPICLVFAKERSVPSIKEALFAGRTVTWYRNHLAGRAEVVQELIESCISAKSTGMLGPSSILEIDFTNNSDARFILQNESEFDFYENSEIIELQPHSTTRIKVLTSRTRSDEVRLNFNVLNASIGYKMHPSLQYTFDK